MGSHLRDTSKACRFFQALRNDDQDTCKRCWGIHEEVLEARSSRRIPFWLLGRASSCQAWHFGVEIPPAVETKLLEMLAQHLRQLRQRQLQGPVGNVRPDKAKSLPTSWRQNSTEIKNSPARFSGFGARNSIEREIITSSARPRLPLLLGY